MLAGQKAARRTLEIALPLLNDGRELKFFVLPNDHDPDSLIRREGWKISKSFYSKLLYFLTLFLLILLGNMTLVRPKVKVLLWAN